jgi:alkanesulfonate monooxygenase SsuD/methylene tetrahydromethanopterin reductase-like flavin-dependent oxidoreductase (luciferase family)
MKFGAHIFATDETIDVGDLAAVLEDLGFESLWLPEHTHIPISRETSWIDGGDLPVE